ncbi:TRAP-type C4-dicarboxylate transport system, periplasmic component [Halarchaeum acidiphilum MH1-52-1]|uniref:TRAP-type C4-dicarboxylate transport system, periplasmic component n=1 Tax=Halarchaeum acidiphilum MH1-52-1 TaxID=1261545 RepID=U2YF07_9EURY|nr:TRAP transporter substrate-binding protein [Halarchaeum acidiphilum]GAD52506.1 TRAP-type C4-dicarboxylate transport system, periplasmic component [Halarchaeum acidiphilum MH1-52-1]
MTVATSYQPGHILVQIANEFKKRVESESDGSISVNVSSGGAYGSESKISELVKSGGVNAQTVGGLVWHKYAPKYAFFSNPYVMEDFEQITSVFESDAFQPAFDQIQQNGNQYELGQQVYIGKRHVTSNTPIRSPDDLKGIDLRLPELDSIVAIWNAIGASPTPVALDELYSALDNGVVDASEGPAEQVYSSDLYEVQSHYNKTAHQIETGNLMVNKDFYDGLDQTNQDILDKAGANITKSATDTAKNREEALFDKLSKKGMTIVEDVDVEAFRSAARPAVKEQFKSNWALSWDQVQKQA